MKLILLPILVIGILLLSACGGLTTAPSDATQTQELNLPFADMEIVDNTVVWVGERNWEGSQPPNVWVRLMPSGETLVVTYAQYLELDIQSNPPDWFKQWIELGILDEGAKFIPGETETEWSYISGFDVKIIEYFEANNTKLPDGTYIWTNFLLNLENQHPELHAMLTIYGKEALRLRLNEALEAMEPYKINEIPPFKYAVSEAKLAGVDDKHLTLLFGEEVISDGQ
jgi:hypothetical protein